MGFFAKLKSWFQTPASTSKSDEMFEALQWVEANENPYGVRLLDCRPIAETLMSATKDSRSIEFFDSKASHSGECFRGQHPDEAIRVACDLRYPLPAPLPEGPLFLASVMEEKWNIYHFARTLYFARSWTGHLQYTARLAESVSELHVVEVEAWQGNVLGVDQLAFRQVDYLIKSHVFNQIAPHPVPAFLESKESVATWSFSQYGRRGFFAVPELESVASATHQNE